MVFIIFLIVLSVSLVFVGFGINFLKFGSFTEFDHGWMPELSTHVGFEGLIGSGVSPSAGG